MRIWITLCISAVLLAAFAAAEENKPVNWEGLPDPFHTESATNRPNVIERPSGASLVVPQGFKVEEYITGDFKRPRFMLLGPNDELVFSDSGSRNVTDGTVYVHHDGATRKLIERAKGILQRDLGFTEEQSYLKLQQESRRRRMPMKQVAEAVVLSDDLRRAQSDK